MASVAERRARFRRILKGDVCVHPASVFDPVSARIAEGVGFEVGVLPGSIAAAAVLGVPDIVLLTMPEFVEQARRIGREGGLSLIADADHGYGNALNAQRTVEELENAGVAALTLEDTLLPAQFGRSGEEMISTKEMVGKLKAAMAARQDPTLSIVGRTNALRCSTLADAVDRLKAYRDAGADATMVVGLKSMEQVEALGKGVGAPIILGSVAQNTPAPLTDTKALASHGIRVAFQGHYAFLAGLKAMQEVLKFLREGGNPAELKARVASDEVYNQLTLRGAYLDKEKKFMSHAESATPRA